MLVSARNHLQFVSIKLCYTLLWGIIRLVWSCLSLTYFGSICSFWTTAPMDTKIVVSKIDLQSLSYNLIWKLRLTNKGLLRKHCWIKSFNKTNKILSLACCPLQGWPKVHWEAGTRTTSDEELEGEIFKVPNPSAQDSSHNIELFMIVWIN